MNAKFAQGAAGVLETLVAGLGEEKENGPVMENRPDDWRDDKDGVCGWGWGSTGDGNGDGNGEDDDDEDDAAGAAADTLLGCTGNGCGGVRLPGGGDDGGGIGGGIGVGADGESGGDRRDAMSISMDDRRRARKISSLMWWNPGLFPDSPSRMSNTFTVTSKSWNTRD